MKSLLLSLLLVGLCACGQKGELYLVPEPAPVDIEEAEEAANSDATSQVLPSIEDLN